MQMPTVRAMRGAFQRGRRALRRRLLEPVLVGYGTLRETVMNALAARGHLVFCDLGDVRFFVDPSDRVVGTWLMWHGSWQRREIDSAIEVLSNAGRLPPEAVFVDVEHGERFVGDFPGDGVGLGFDLRVIPATAQQIVCNTRRAAAAAGNLGSTDWFDLDVQDTGGAGDDGGSMCRLRTTAAIFSKCRWCASMVCWRSLACRLRRSASPGSTSRATSRRHSPASPD